VADPDTDYTVRATARANHTHTRFTVVDQRGIIHHVTVNDTALYHGHGDAVIRAMIAHTRRILAQPKGWEHG
jgi:hypothetical protein